MTTIQHDLARTTFAVLFIVGLMAVLVWILRPFLPALIWAAMKGADLPLLLIPAGVLGGWSRSASSGSSSARWCSRWLTGCSERAFYHRTKCNGAAALGR